jgi:DNA-binding NarL/FixJ family response regulator
MARPTWQERVYAVATVLVCDDSALVRETLHRVLASVPGITRVVDASSGEEALSRWPVARHPEAVVIMVTVAEDAEGVARAVASGARGYLVKDATREEMAAIVVHALSDAVWRRPVPAPRSVEGASAAPALTEREMQVLTGMSRGRSNSEIGKELFLSEDTVKTHARRLFRKLGAADRAQAVAVGFRWGMVR